MHACMDEGNWQKCERSPAPTSSQFCTCPQEMAVYEQFIMGMLTNHSAGLPLDRIHNMLKMYVSEPQYDKSAGQLETFLGQLIANDKLAAANGLYTRRTQW